MAEQNFLSNVDNKEILNEILNNSIEFLIGNQSEQQIMRMSHKYGFHNPDDFLFTTRSIAKFYRSISFIDVDSDQYSDIIKSRLPNLSPEFKKIITCAFQARRDEVISYLIQKHNASECALIESFDWDTRLVLGNSSFAQNRKLLTTLTLNMPCNDQKVSKQLYVEMDSEKLNEFIKAIKDVLDDK